jgi:hypothetical protein
MDTIHRNADILINASEETGLEMNVKKSICWCLDTRMQVNIGKSKYEINRMEVLQHPYISKER